MAQTFGSAEDADLAGVGNVKQNSIQIKNINKLNIKAPKKLTFIDVNFSIV